MRMHTVLALAVALLAALSVAFAGYLPQGPAAQGDDVRAIDGEWIFVEDRTEGRPIAEHQPSTSSKLTFRVEKDAVVLVRRESEIRMPLDGTPTDVGREGRTSRYRGQWKDGAFTYEIELLRDSDETRTGLIRMEFRPTAEGLLVRVEVDPPTGMKSLALYRHAKDIPLPAPAKATLADLAWLPGAWVGTRGAAGTTSIEERWSPPLGGSMLAVSRTVSRGKMVAYEFLRISERDGGLVYIAQPNGTPPTTFVLTELSANRAVFENPRHDSPQRIVYELSPEGGLSASIGYAKGGRPQRFEFKPEPK
ncbi:MAG: DUF6265 family protein [Phycisphaerales bacterium]